MKGMTKERRDELRKSTPVPDLDKLPDDALLNDRQVSVHSGFAEYTLRLWRMKHKGPKVVYIEGRPRYRVGDYKAWLNSATSTRAEAA